MISHPYKLVEQTLCTKMATFERFQFQLQFETIEKANSFLTPSKFQNLEAFQHFKMNVNRPQYER